MKLFLKGERCFGPKCAVERRTTRQAITASAGGKLPSTRMQLQEKQKARHIYGVLERQFRKHFAQAERRRA